MSPTRSLPIRRGLGTYVFALSIVIWAFSYYAWHVGRYSLPIHLLISTLPMFLVTVVAHDAAHGAVHRNRRMNDAVGWMCGLVQGTSFGVFKRAHLLHHAHTMRAGDPDLWVHGRFWRLPPLPVRWLAGNWNYYRVFGKCDRRVRVATVAQVIGTLLLVGSEPTGMLLGWILPVQLAIFLFAIFAAWLPHGVYDISVGGDNGRWPRRDSVTLQWITLFHEDHHLRPAYPFYQYPELFAARHRTQASPVHAGPPDVRSTSRECAAA